MISKDGLGREKSIITSNKSVHATQPDGTPNILIDDFGKNIAKWEAAGGVGFKHKDHKFERTVKNLKHLIDIGTNCNLRNLPVTSEPIELEIAVTATD